MVSRKTNPIRVHESFERELAKMQKDLHRKIVGQFPDIEVDSLPAALTSKVLASRMREERFIDFRIKKRGLNRGFIELI